MRSCRTMTSVCLLSLFAGVAFSDDAEVLESKKSRGPVQAVVRLKPAKPRIGDVVTLTIEVTAPKGVELLMPEFGEALDRFRIVDFVPRESIDQEGRTVAFQQYRLEPPSSGAQAIPPILIEFVDRRPGERATPEDFDAYELLTERVDFEVESVLPEGADAELKPPKGRLEAPVVEEASSWPWIVGSIVLLMAASVAGAWTVLTLKRRARRRSAYEVARSNLDRLVNAPRPTGEQVDAFYVELSAIVRRYLEDRYELRAPELTTEEFLNQVMGAPQLSGEQKGMLRDFLRQADLVKFAGVRPGAEVIELSLSAASRFLDETRENAPLVDEPTSERTDEEVSHV